MKEPKNTKRLWRQGDVCGLSPIILLLLKFKGNHKGLPLDDF